MLLTEIQRVLRAEQLEAWLFFDHHHRDPLAYRILGLGEDVHASRRWYYLVPATGEPLKLVHQIEPHTLDDLPGDKLVYASWQDQRRKLSQLLHGLLRVAMQYSPQCAVPSISLVDAGTIELVRSAGAEPITSANLIQFFDSTWTAAQYESHIAAGRLVDLTRSEAFHLISDCTRTTHLVTEYEVQQFILERFRERGLVSDHGPIVASNAHASDPHYEPSSDHFSPLKTGDLVLIDMWAKLSHPGAVFYDITWTGYCGDNPPEPVAAVFGAVTEARRQAARFVMERVGESHAVHGFEVDDVARDVISRHGFGAYFFHRLGHSIGTEVHGTGAHLDNYESHDERRLIPNTCFSIEPGVYLPEFGIRSEVNMFVGDGKAKVTGEEQDRLLCL